MKSLAHATSHPDTPLFYQWSEEILEEEDAIHDELQETLYYLLSRDINGKHAEADDVVEMVKVSLASLDVLAIRADMNNTRQLASEHTPPRAQGWLQKDESARKAQQELKPDLGKVYRYMKSAQKMQVMYEQEGSPAPHPENDSKKRQYARSATM